MLKDLQPDLAAVCWDEGLPARRTELQPGYKQHRSEMPSEMVPQIPFIRDLVPKLGLHGVSLPDTEADDLMASYCCTAHSAGNGGDPRHQRQGPPFPRRGRHPRLFDGQGRPALAGESSSPCWDPAAISKKWGVPPPCILDVLALSGDASDNIPGVAGVGPKTATTLIQNAGSLEQLLADVDSIKNEKLRAKIADAREQIVQNREMVRLDTDLPVPVPLDDLVIAPRYDELIAALEWCEFRSMLAEVRAEAKRVGASAGKDGGTSGQPAAVQDDLFPF